MKLRGFFPPFKERWGSGRKERAMLIVSVSISIRSVIVSTIERLSSYGMSFQLLYRSLASWRIVSDERY